MYLAVLISFRVYYIARPGTSVIIDFHATWNFNRHLEGNSTFYSISLVAESMQVLTCSCNYISLAENTEPIVATTTSFQQCFDQVFLSPRL